MKSIAKTSIFIALTFFCSSAFSQNFYPVKEIPSGKALVYIYRPSSFTGIAVNYYVNANDAKVSTNQLRNGTYLVYYAEPGKYAFWSSVSTVFRLVHLDVEAGKTYYVRAKNCRGFTIPATEKAEKEIVKCNLSEK